MEGYDISGTISSTRQLCQSSSKSCSVSQRALAVEELLLPRVSEVLGKLWLTMELRKIAYLA